MPNARARKVEPKVGKPVWSGRAQPKAAVGSPSVTGLIALQRAAGNRAVAGLVAACRPAGSGRAVGVQRLIAVGGGANDYAIMKQVQQLKAHHSDDVVFLDPNVSLKGIGRDEKLYIVSHGNRETGDLAPMPTSVLVSWLTHETKGLPQTFAGIVVLACYSGLPRKNLRSNDSTADTSSLADRIAEGIEGHVDPGIPVEGTKGYSFGSTEMRTGHSSVLSLDLEPFYEAKDLERMKAVWLQWTPTHTGGVLKDVLKIDEVDTTKTIEMNLLKLVPGEEKARKELDIAVVDVMINFAKKAHLIEERLRALINEIGVRAKEKAGWFGIGPVSKYFKENPEDPKITEWEGVIAEQFKLFEDHYLWSKGEAAFRVVTTRSAKKRRVTNT